MASEMSLAMSFSGSAESIKEIEKKKLRRRRNKEGEKNENEIQLGEFLGNTAFKRLNATKDTRWILPPNSTKTIVVTFVGDSPKITHSLQFGLVGSQKILTLPCLGTTAFPAIQHELNHVFSNKILKVRGTTALVRKQVVASSKTFDFGAILAGKPREGYLDYKHPENYEKLKV